MIEETSLSLRPSRTRLSTVRQMSQFTSLVRHSILFKYQTIASIRSFRHLFTECLFECFQVSLSLSVRLLSALFRVNVLDRFSREQQVRSLARSIQAPFLPSSCRLCLVSIALAPVRLTGRRDAAASALSRRAALRSRARSRRCNDGRNLDADTGDSHGVPLGSLRGIEIRADRKRRFRSRDRSIDLSIDVADFPSSGRSHRTLQDDPATFHRSFSRSSLHSQSKRKKERRNPEQREFDLFPRFFLFFFYTKRDEFAHRLKLNLAVEARGPRLFPRRGKRLFHEDVESGVPKRPSCSRSYLAFGAGVEWRLSFLPTLGLPPACLSLPPPRDHREPTTHSSRIYAITTPCSTPCGRCTSSTRLPFFLNSPLSRSPEGLGEAANRCGQTGFLSLRELLSLYIKKNN